MDLSLYLAQFEQKINGMIGAKKYTEAYNTCKQLLLRYPDEKSLLKLKTRIEKEVIRENDKIIEEKLTSVKPLWKTENYSEILTTLKGLLALSPNNGKLKKLYLEAQGKYQKQIDKLQSEFINKQTARLNELLEKAPKLLLDSLFELEKENFGNKIVLDLTENYRDKLIQKKITEKEELIYSDKYQDIENFIEQLKKIDDKNTRIADLEKLINARHHQTHLIQKNEFVYAGEKHLDTLLKLKKYDKAVKAAEELLAIKPENKIVKRILKTAQRKYSRQLYKESAKKIKENFQNLKTEYSSDPMKFIKL